MRNAGVLGVVIASLFLTALQSGPQPVVSADRLMGEFQSVCLDGDGDPDIAADMATALGYEPAQHLIPNDLFQREGLIVFSKIEDGAEWRIVTKAKWIRGGGSEARHNRCYVSVDPSRLRAARETVRRWAGFDSFSQQDTSVFAWLPREGGRREPVSRARFETALLRLSNEEGLRYILVAAHRDQVILTYIAPY